MVRSNNRHAASMMICGTKNDRRNPHDASMMTSGGTDQGRKNPPPYASMMIGGPRKDNLNPHDASMMISGARKGSMDPYEASMMISGTRKDCMDHRKGGMYPHEASMMITGSRRVSMDPYDSSMMRTNKGRKDPRFASMMISGTRKDRMNPHDASMMTCGPSEDSEDPCSSMMRPNKGSNYPRDASMMPSSGTNQGSKNPPYASMLAHETSQEQTNPYEYSTMASGEAIQGRKYPHGSSTEYEKLERSLSSLADTVCTPPIEKSTEYEKLERSLSSLVDTVRAVPPIENGMRLLGPDFKGPGPFDVICARGKRALNHEGNKTFRAMISDNLDNYSNAKTKLDKSLIVSLIVDAVRQKSPAGGFVKEDNGKWYEVGDHIAREKCGQSFRDSLHNKYKSSTKAKMRRRKKIQEKMGSDVSAVINSNSSVATRMQKISLEVSNNNTTTTKASSDHMKHLFDEANIELLDQIKHNSPSNHPIPQKAKDTTGQKKDSNAAMSCRKEKEILDIEPIRWEDARPPKALQERDSGYCPNQPPVLDPYQPPVFDSTGASYTASNFSPCNQQHRPVPGNFQPDNHRQRIPTFDQFTNNAAARFFHIGNSFEQPVDPLEQDVGPDHDKDSKDRERFFHVGNSFEQPVDPFEQDVDPVRDKDNKDGPRFFHAGNLFEPPVDLLEQDADPDRDKDTKDGLAEAEV